jgi:plasmid stability protein
MEAEAREILRASLSAPSRSQLGTQIHERFAGLGLDSLEVPPRDETPRTPDLAA